MEFYLNEILQSSVLLLYYRGLLYGEGFGNFVLAEKFMREAFRRALDLLEGCHPGNFSTVIKIRLYLAKLMVHQGEWKQAEELLVDNIRDSEIELSLRQGKNPTSHNNQKAQKCVIFLNQDQTSCSLFAGP